MGFMASNKTVNISVDYVDVGETDIIVIRTDSQKQMFEGKIKTVKAKFDRPRWSNFNRYISGCVKEETDSGRTELDTMKLREQKLMTLLVSIEDDDGKSVKLDADFYMNVNPDFAIGLVEAYDEQLNKERIDFLEDMGVLDDDDEIESAEKSEKSEKSEKESEKESEKVEINKD